MISLIWCKTEAYLLLIRNRHYLLSLFCLNLSFRQLYCLYFSVIKGGQLWLIHPCDSLSADVLLCADASEIFVRSQFTSTEIIGGKPLLTFKFIPTFRMLQQFYSSWIYLLLVDVFLKFCGSAAVTLGQIRSNILSLWEPPLRGVGAQLRLRLSSVLRNRQHSIGYMGDGLQVKRQKTQPTVSKYWRNK